MSQKTVNSVTVKVSPSPGHATAVPEASKRKLAVAVHCQAASSSCRCLQWLRLFAGRGSL